jgi:hypothetical protein
MSDELFDGLQIMSPDELNAAVKATDDSSADNTKIPSAGESGEFEFKPVTTETGEGAYANDNKDAAATKDTGKDSSDGETRNEAVYKALMKELVTAGILTAAEVEKLDELPGTLDSIKELMSKTVENNFKNAEENWRKSLPAAKKRFLEIEDAFDETDQAIMMAQRLEFFDNLNVEDVKNNVDLQKQIYFEQLKSKNFSDEDAIEAINDAEETNKLAQKALKAIPELKAESDAIVQESRIAKDNRTKAEIVAQTKAFENLLTNIDNRDAFIDGLNLNKISKDKLKSNILNPVYKDPQTGKELNSLMYKQQRNPVEFEMLINYYDTLGLFNLDREGKFKPDISKLKAVAKTSAINELDKVIASEDRRVGRNTSVETSKKTEDALSLLERAFNTNK